LAENAISRHIDRRSFAIHGWIGLVLIGVFWTLNWTLPGTRTFWAFFPLWLGYCLTVDAINLWRNGTSLMARNWRKYIGLFLVSAPVWWLFEVLNWRVQNWHYLGRDLINNWQYVLFASISFSIVIPAVFGTAELVRSFGFVQRLKPWLVIRPDRRTTMIFFGMGCFNVSPSAALAEIFLLAFVDLSLFYSGANQRLDREPFVGRLDQEWGLAPGCQSLPGRIGDRFFLGDVEFNSFPKWVYTVPYVNVLHIFEMPLLGYGGYLPFACELFAIYNLITGWLYRHQSPYVKL